MKNFADSQRAFRKLTIILAAVLVFATISINCQTIEAQTASRAEYVQSTSRMPDGRVVTRTVYSDGRAPQTVISSPPRVANLPANPQNNFAATYPRPNPAQTGGTANTAPSLNDPPNVLPNVTNAPNQTNPFTSGPVTGGLPPHVNPALPANQPNMGLPGGQIYPYPAGNVQQGWPPQRPYQPIVKFRTLPGNTYIGQGIIGQPKAYIPGEPIRNAIRYIMP